MVRADLIKLLAADWPELSAREIEKVVDAFCDAIIGQLADGGRVEIRRFGSFTTRARDGRTARNPRTGETVELADRRVPWFNAGRKLLGMIRAGAAASPG